MGEQWLIQLTVLILFALPIYQSQIVFTDNHGTGTYSFEVAEIFLNRSTVNCFAERSG
jgi:hypothetical protein